MHISSRCYGRNEKKSCRINRALIVSPPEWFGPDLAHVAAGGQKDSWWVSILAGVAAQVVLTMAFALVLLLESEI